MSDRLAEDPRAGAPRGRDAGEARGDARAAAQADVNPPQASAQERPTAPHASGPHRLIRRISAWLGRAQLGLMVMALAVGGAAGLGAVVFRELIFGFTWLATAHQEFGQQGRIPSPHLPFLGIWFLLLVPVLGGLLYGPLIQRFAREARGHGVPEVMLAVAENGGRIRPPVTVIKAVASAMCIGAGGSIGREGPIVQVGSALASTMGQIVRMSETRLRVIVACGAAGGISATFNAPVTGLFFGFEIILREFSMEALFGVILSSVTADLVSRAFFGSAPFFGHLPHVTLVTHDYQYLLVAVLGLAAGLAGVGFKSVLYRLEDYVDLLWRGRPEWARPAVGGVVLGGLLLALPQMYGVGYPVMDRVLAGHEALWLLAILMAGKIAAASLTLSIGGSGGVFAPSLFTGAAGGMAFGVIAHDIFGAASGPAALYGIVAMGGVFAGAAQAPLTSIASVLEMTGDFSVTLSVMLVAGIAAAVSKRLTYGSIYTTKLLRRGIDIDRPRASSALEGLTVADAMQVLPAPVGDRWLLAPQGSQPEGDGPRAGVDAGAVPGAGVGAGVRTTEGAARAGGTGVAPMRAGGSDTAKETRANAEEGGGAGDERWERLVGPVTSVRSPQVLFDDEDLAQALRQLVLYGRDGLPVLSHDGRLLRGWLTRNNVLRLIGERVRSSAQEIEKGALAAEFAVDDPARQVHTPTRPLRGYRLVELTVAPGSAVAGHRIDEIGWPEGARVVAVTERREIVAAREDTELTAGQRMIVLVPREVLSAESSDGPPSPEPSPRDPQGAHPPAL